MKYSIEMQVGYYEDDDSYHGPFKSCAHIEAETTELALQGVERLLQEKKVELQEPMNMTDGVVLTIHDSLGKLCYEHAFGILAAEAAAASTNRQAVAKVSARLKTDPNLARRARAALRAAGLEAIKEILGPLASIVLAALEAWNDPDNH